MKRYIRKANHYMLARLDLHMLVVRIRCAAENQNLILWEMIGLNNMCQTVKAGSVIAKRLGINEGEIIGYLIPEGGGHFMGSAFVDAMVNDQSHAPPKEDIIGTIRWRAQQATTNR